MRLRITYRAFNSGGKGGQHGNRTMNAITASVALDDGRTIQATSQSLKSQHANKRAATAILKQRVREALEGPPKERIRNAETVRTYHEADNRVTDHRSQLKTPWKSIDKDFARHVSERSAAFLMGKPYQRGAR